MTVVALPLEASAWFERDRARFLCYADRPSFAACWHWQGYCERYGRFSLGLRKVWAHRAAWLLWRRRQHEREETSRLHATFRTACLDGPALAEGPGGTRRDDPVTQLLLKALPLDEPQELQPEWEYVETVGWYTSTVTGKTYALVVLKDTDGRQ